MKACLCLCSGKESKDSVIWKMTRLNREDQGPQAHNWTQHQLIKAKDSP